jgi:hypothetical protein
LCVGISHSKSVVTVCGYCATCISCEVFVPPLPRDFTDLKARVIAAVKNYDVPMLTRVCGKNLNIVSMCALSYVVHTSNFSSCQKKNFSSFPVAVNNSIEVGRLVFLL